MGLAHHNHMVQRCGSTLRYLDRAITSAITEVLTAGKVEKSGIESKGT